MGLVVNKDSYLIFDDKQFVELAVNHFGGAAKVLDNYGTLMQKSLGGISTEQASGLGYLSLTKIVPFYLSLPNVNGASFYGIDDATAVNFVSRFPVCLESYNNTQKIKHEFAQWNPSFQEAALFASMLFVCSYSGENAVMKRFQELFLKACNMNIWQLSNGDTHWYNKRWQFFRKMSAMLQESSNGMLIAIQGFAQSDFVLSSLLGAVAQTQMYAEKLMESNPAEIDDSENAF